MRSAVRSSTAYARTVWAPTTDSDTAPSRSPIRSRTVAYATASRFCSLGSAIASGTKHAHTSSVSGHE